MHKEFGLPNPLHENCHISSLLKGIKQCKGDSPQQKHPITVSILREIHAKLNFTSSVDAYFWAICLVAFFWYIRKSHLLIKGKSSFDAFKQFVKTDFLFFTWGVIVKVRWSKTIQFREREILIPLPRATGSALCPVTAIIQAFSFTKHAPSDCQASPVSLQWQPFTYHLFLSKLREVLYATGLDASMYGTHSFRRGGASFAFQSGIPIELIKILGEWKSSAVLLYLTAPLNIRINAIHQIKQHIPHLFTQQLFLFGGILL